MKDIDKIAQEMGAKVVGKVPDTGGGAFGAARLAAAVSSLKGRDMVDRHDFFEVCVVVRAEEKSRRLFAAHGLRTDHLGMGESPAEALMELGMALIDLVYLSETEEDLCVWRATTPEIVAAALSPEAVRMPDSVMDGVGWFLRAEPRPEWVKDGDGGAPKPDQDRLARFRVLDSVTKDVVKGDGPFVCSVDWKWLQGEMDTAARWAMLKAEHDEEFAAFREKRKSGPFSI